MPHRTIIIDPPDESLAPRLAVFWTGCAMGWLKCLDCGKRLECEVDAQRNAVLTDAPHGYLSHARAHLTLCRPAPNAALDKAPGAV